MKRVLPALAAFALTTSLLVLPALSLPQHGDEKMHIWKAGYYGSLLARLNTSAEMRDEYTDPGWSPRAFWGFDQPFGSAWLYALVLGATGTNPPSQPYSYSDRALQGPETAIPQATLPAVRLAAVLLAAIGLSLIAYRFGWPALVATVIFLAIPSVRDDLCRGWAEGPLLFGFGLAALSYGTRWFAATCGIAATFKLTALGLWPLAFWHGFGKGRYSHILGLAVATATWTALEPPSWFAGGSSYLLSTCKLQTLHHRGCQW